MGQLIINLSSPYILKEIPAKIISGSTITINSIVDNYLDKKVIAYCERPFGVVVLWEGLEYDIIGQWTDSDVYDKIYQIYGL